MSEPCVSRWCEWPVPDPITVDRQTRPARRLTFPAAPLMACWPSLTSLWDVWTSHTWKHTHFEIPHLLGANESPLERTASWLQKVLSHLAVYTAQHRKVCMYGKEYLHEEKKKNSICYYKLMCILMKERLSEKGMVSFQQCNAQAWYSCTHISQIIQTNGPNMLAFMWACPQSVWPLLLV